MYRKERQMCIAALVLAAVLCVGLLPISAFATESGSCGENLMWSLENGTLTITGSGAMTDYEDGALPPWYDQRAEITAVVLPDKLTSIGDIAFFECTKLKTVAIPDSVEYVGSYAFAGCTGLLTVSFPSELNKIKDNAFRECTALSAIRLPSRVESIGNQAFYRCYGLTSVIVPESVTNMGKQVFAYCTGLVQATVNASLETLPDWTFYGCTSLSSISLPAMMTAAGEYAFDGCDSLDAVYTRSYDIDVAGKLERNMNGGHVATYDPPATTITSKRDASTNSTTEVSETNNSVIAVTHISDTTGNNSIVEATVENSDGWTEVSGTVSDVSGRTEELNVTVQMTGSVVTGEDLRRLAGKKVLLTIKTNEGVVWRLRMENIEAESLADSYNLGVSASIQENGKPVPEAGLVYHVAFDGKTNFQAEVGIPLTTECVYQTATLYQKSGQGLKNLQTVVVDADGTAWFRVEGTDNRTSYCIGIGAADADTQEAIIPETMYSEYGGLTDANGVQYVITGRSSRWGITGGQFAIYVAITFGVIVLVVSSAMITFHKMKQSKMKYAALAMEDIEDEIDENALRLKIMQEMLEETRKSSEK